MIMNPSPRRLCRKARRMVYDVLKFMQKEAREGMCELKSSVRRAALATGTSESTVSRINLLINQASGVKTLERKRPIRKRVTDIDNLNKGIIKRCVHNFHKTEHALPTLKRLVEKLKASIEFKGSVSSLGHILKDLGFEWKKTEDNRKLLIEHPNVRLSRIEYLRKIRQYRSEGRPIVYTGETYIESPDKNKSTAGCDDMPKNGVHWKQPIALFYAGSEDGFLPDALLTFPMETMNANYNMTYKTYEKWIRTQVVPSLPHNSVLVINNAPYKNKLEDPVPSPDAQRSELEYWLLERNIPFSSSMLKPELYKLICLNTDRITKYKIDRVLQEKYHKTLRLPPYHPDLNPMDLAMDDIKSYVAESRIHWSTSTLNNIVNLKVDKMTGMGAWSVFCDKIKRIENEYSSSDEVIDVLTEERVIYVNDHDDCQQIQSDDSCSDSSDDMI